MTLPKRDRDLRETPGRPGGGLSLGATIDSWIDAIAPSPWLAHAGSRPCPPRRAFPRPAPAHTPLYTPEERARRDSSGWTTVQAVLAPLQFAVFLVSLFLILRFLATGVGYEAALISVVAKTGVLYLIMVTGSIWEKEVFGRWLFARAFFWEDVFSIVVLGLHTAYLAALIFGWGTPVEQLQIAIAAYATYVINAGQFLLKLRAARLEQAAPPLGAAVGAP
ncbi:MAG: 2-vinyl bacteriochlorophyllide hydratase [Alphaproteobacteria bacterium]|nr:2-vinyl bacteriochlorophyllide hydratase [Alphaproteobacteria bacterium]